MAKLGLGVGLIAGCLLAGVAVENSSPGSTAPAADHTRTATNNLLVTLGGMVSDAGHTIIPVASDLVDTARTEFPNVLGPQPGDPAAGGTGTGTGTGTAQHPPAATDAPQP
jgi:hypothetical protein